MNVNRAELKKYSSGGARNKENFQRAIAQLKEDKGAYKNYEDAMKAAKNKQYIQSMSLVENALQQQPNENLFWELKGQLLLQQDKNKESVPALDKAIQLNPNYYKPYVFRGIAYKELGNANQAEKDLIASQTLLPTQMASFYLGDINAAKGNRGAAATYYKEAASGGGQLGDEAKTKLAQMGYQ